jgi:hypothetical protein
LGRRDVTYVKELKQLFKTAYFKQAWCGCFLFKDIRNDNDTAIMDNEFENTDEFEME